MIVTLMVMFDVIALLSDGAVPSKKGGVSC